MKAVFDTKPASIYNDDLGRHYHYPSQYRSIIERCVGDWIIFRRPKRGGGDMAYFGIARVSAIEPDPTDARMSYARLDSHWQFARPVPLVVAGRYWEEALRAQSSSTAGAYLQGRSAREISEKDFTEIVEAGLGDTFAPENLSALNLPAIALDEANEALRVAVDEAHPRQVERVLTSRIIREASFRRMICSAYDHRCAVTGLQVFDGAGNAEVQAAHIWSVANGGPDIVHNGIALSSTIHWLFDRHLITIGDDLSLIVARDKIPAELQASLVRDGMRLHLPRKEANWPLRPYLEMHREIFFSKNNKISV